MSKANRHIPAFGKLLVSALILFGLSAPVMAQTDIKIAVLDIRAALYSSEQAEQADASMKAETAEDREQYTNLAEQIQGLQEQMQRDGATMSEAERNRIVDQVNQLGLQANYLQEKLQKVMQQRSAEFEQANASSVMQAIQEVVEEDGYDVVLRADAVIYSDSGKDITAKVIEKLNQL